MTTTRSAVRNSAQLDIEGNDVNIQLPSEYPLAVASKLEFLPNDRR